MAKPRYTSQVDYQAVNQLWKWLSSVDVNGGCYSVAGRRRGVLHATNHGRREVPRLVERRKSWSSGFVGALRVLAVLFVSATYLFSGIAHAFNDFDADESQARIGIEMLSALSDVIKHVKDSPGARHHCHGCFSASIPAQPMAELTAVELDEIVVGWDVSPLIGRTRGLDPPPPKSLI